MFRFLFIILLYYILIFQNVFGLTQANNTCPVCDCNCNCFVQIEAVNDDLDEDGRKSVDKIDTKASSIEMLPIGDQVSKHASCMEAAANSLTSGIYQIQLKKLNITDLKVFCEEDVEFGGWLVIQRRQSGSVDFNRDWHDYKEGFGDLTGNYWIGLEKLHTLTSSCEQELYIQIKTNNSEEYYAKYTELLIGDESESYTLKKLGNFSGTAGDGLKGHLEKKFSTYDRDNDNYPKNCAVILSSGWWFNSCYYSHLNGVYGDVSPRMKWIHLTFSASLTFVQMMIRPTQNCFRRLLLSNLDRCV